MSSALVRLALVAGLLAVAVAGVQTATANALSVEDLLAGGLLPSSAPGLLGPITSVGRKGWDCKPEHVASAAQWRDAELPPPDSR